MVVLQRVAVRVLGGTPGMEAEGSAGSRGGRLLSAPRVQCQPLLLPHIQLPSLVLPPPDKKCRPRSHPGLDSPLQLSAPNTILGQPVLLGVGVSSFVDTEGVRGGGRGGLWDRHSVLVSGAQLWLCVPLLAVLSSVVAEGL